MPTTTLPSNRATPVRATARGMHRIHGSTSSTISMVTPSSTGCTSTRSSITRGSALIIPLVGTSLGGEEATTEATTEDTTEDTTEATTEFTTEATMEAITESNTTTTNSSTHNTSNSNSNNNIRFRRIGCSPATNATTIIQPSPT
mmetsp:Transcript_1673/g.3102  ORF Transcript_1673/g.3102 Transcript_1673/m.3102 type:complete len:145 (+) Transcript_1673:439-873(+)